MKTLEEARLDNKLLILHTGIRGKNAAGATTFEIDAADGLGKFGAGLGTIGPDGISIKGQLLRMLDALGNVHGLLYVSDPSTGDRLFLYSPDAPMTIFTPAGENLTLDPGGIMNIILAAAGLIIGGVGDVTVNNKLTAITNLRIPTYNGADPAALASGDIWLREDL